MEEAMLKIQESVLAVSIICVGSALISWYVSGVWLKSKSISASKRSTVFSMLSLILMLSGSYIYVSAKNS